MTEQILGAAAPRSASPRAEDMSLIAAQAALAFDSAVQKRRVDMTPVLALGDLIQGQGTLEASAKKALARLAQAPKAAATQESITGRPNRNTPVPTTLEKLTRATRDGLSKLDDADLVELRSFCVKLSVLARTPRPRSVLGLR